MATKLHVLITGAAGLVGGMYASTGATATGCVWPTFSLSPICADHEESINQTFATWRLLPRRVEILTSSYIQPPTAARAPTL